jgi:hypothetical protein
MDAATIDARRERGLALANDRRIKRIAGNAWSVPSASGNGSYVVDAAAGACSCPDHETRRTRCKHLHAVATVIARETVTETVTKAVAPRGPMPFLPFFVGQISRVIFLHLLAIVGLFE